MSSNTEASKAMLAAALGGLLGLGGSGCVIELKDSTTGDSTSTGTTDPTTTSAGGESSTGGANTTSAADGGSTSSDGGAGGAGGATNVGGAGGAGGSTSADGGGGSGGGGSIPTNPHTPIPNTECSSGVVANPMVTKTTMQVFTEQEFKDLCNQKNGIFEVQPLCGGSNACRGIAYDSGTGVLTEHTCQSTNTCAGYNCVICN